MSSKLCSINCWLQNAFVCQNWATVRSVCMVSIFQHGRLAPLLKMTFRLMPHEMPILNMHDTWLSLGGFLKLCARFGFDRLFHFDKFEVITVFPTFFFLKPYFVLFCIRVASILFPRSTEMFFNCSTVNRWTTVQNPIGKKCDLKRVVSSFKASSTDSNFYWNFQTFFFKKLETMSFHQQKTLIKTTCLLIGNSRDYLIQLNQLINNERE